MGGTYTAVSWFILCSPLFGLANLMASYCNPEGSTSLCCTPEMLVFQFTPVVSASFLFSIPAVLTFSLVGGLHYTPEILNWVPYSALVSSVTPTNFPATLTVSDKSSSSIEVPWRSKRSSAVLFLSEAASWWTFTIIYGGAGKGVKERRLTQQPVQKFRNQYEPWIITLGPRVYESTVN